MGDHHQPPAGDGVGHGKAEGAAAVGLGAEVGEEEGGLVEVLTKRRLDLFVGFRSLARRRGGLVVVVAAVRLFFHTFFRTCHVFRRCDLGNPCVFVEHVEKHSGFSATVHAIEAVIAIQLEERIVGGQLKVEQPNHDKLHSDDGGGDEPMVVAEEAAAPNIDGRQAEVPVVVGELLERGVVHACKQGRFQGFALVVLHVDSPGLLAAGVEFVAHRGQADVEVEIVVRHEDMPVAELVAVFLHEGGGQRQAATVGLGDLIADFLDVVVEGDPTFQPHLFLVFQLYPHFHVVGRATDVEPEGLAGVAGVALNLVPGHFRRRKLLGAIAVHGEGGGSLRQRVVEALQLDIIYAGLETFLALITNCLSVDDDFVLIDEGLVLHHVVAGGEAVIREEPLQFFVAV